MNAIEEIKAKLQSYPDARYESGTHYIRVLPASEEGFSVGLSTNKNEYIVWFNGWHERFTNADKALNCFAFGLSTDCRLKEYRRRGFAYKWTVEYKEAGEWTEDSTTGLLLYPFWGKLEVRHLQNKLLIKSEAQR